MIIVVNHLTRMHQGRICVAGVDLETRRHVRPVTQWGELDGRVLAGREEPFSDGCSTSERKGPFNMAHVVDLGRVEACPRNPHVEDYQFVPWKARFIERFHADSFWALLNQISRPCLRQIFGEKLRPIGQRACGTEAGLGGASLGVLRLENRPRLFLQPSKTPAGPKIRMSMDDGQMRVEVGVTDLRLYEADHATVNQNRVNRLARYLQGQEHGAVLLGVGLGRAFAARAEDVERPIHWLQVNNIHLKKGPTWGFSDSSGREDRG